MERCDHEHWRKHGRTSAGNQRFKCAMCGKTRSVRRYDVSSKEIKPQSGHIQRPNDDPARRIAYANLQWMKRFGLVGDQEEAIDAAIMAYYQAMADGEIVNDIASEGAKRYIRREMLRAAGRHPELYSRPDYGYCDGRQINRGPLSSSSDSKVRLRHNRMRSGVCKLCGNKRAEKSAYCEQCREKRREQARRSYARKASAQGVTMYTIRTAVGV